jgi:hypothetical protein
MDMRTEGAQLEGHAGHLRRQAGLIPESKLSVYRRAALGRLSVSLVSLGGRMVLYGLPPALPQAAAMQ